MTEELTLCREVVQAARKIYRFIRVRPTLGAAGFRCHAPESFEARALARRGWPGVGHAAPRCRRRTVALPDEGRVQIDLEPGQKSEERLVGDHRLRFTMVGSRNDHTRYPIARVQTKPLCNITRCPWAEPQPAR